MSNSTYVHIVDKDYVRRGQIARCFHEQKVHPEIYEDIRELAGHAPSHGAVFISDDHDADGFAASLEPVHLSIGYLPVAFYSVDPAPGRVVRAVSRGALDYLAWPCSTDELLGSLNRLLTEGGRKAKLERRRAEARRLVNNLTGREEDVLVQLLAGASNKDMAKTLSISPRTVEIYRSSMMSRIGARSAADAVRIGLYAGLDERHENI